LSSIPKAVVMTVTKSARLELQMIEKGGKE
jgi:hypothetical protein